MAEGMDELVESDHACSELFPMTNVSHNDSYVVVTSKKERPPFRRRYTFSSSSEHTPDLSSIHLDMLSPTVTIHDYWQLVNEVRALKVLLMKMRRLLLDKMDSSDLENSKSSKGISRRFSIGTLTQLDTYRIVPDRGRKISVESGEKKNQTNANNDDISENTNNSRRISRKNLSSDFSNFFESFSSISTNSLASRRHAQNILSHGRSSSPAEMAPEASTPRTAECFPKNLLCNGENHLNDSFYHNADSYGLRTTGRSMHSPSYQDCASPSRASIVTANRSTNYQDLRRISETPATDLSEDEESCCNHKKLVDELEKKVDQLQQRNEEFERDINCKNFVIQKLQQQMEEFHKMEEDLREENILLEMEIQELSEELNSLKRGDFSDT